MNLLETEPAREAKHEPIISIEMWPEPSVTDANAFYDSYGVEISLPDSIPRPIEFMGERVHLRVPTRYVKNWRILFGDATVEGFDLKPGIETYLRAVLVEKPYDPQDNRKKGEAKTARRWPFFTTTPFIVNIRIRGTVWRATFNPSMNSKGKMRKSARGNPSVYREIECLRSE